MTVYVDNAMIPATVGRLKARWCHLTADTAEELHVFAQRLGLRSSWCQVSRREKTIHYDVTGRVRARAIRMGAKPVTRREITTKTPRPATAGKHEGDAK